MPDTTAYLWLGLGVTALVMFALIGSMLARYRSLRQDLKTLEQLDEE